MSPELETAAEALHLEYCRRAIAAGMMKEPTPWKDLVESSRRDYRLSAAAVILAIRDMGANLEQAAHDAGVAATDKTNGEFTADGSVWPLFLRPRFMWQAIIDKILEE